MYEAVMVTLVVLSGFCFFSSLLIGVGVANKNRALIEADPLLVNRSLLKAILIGVWALCFSACAVGAILIKAFL